MRLPPAAIFALLTSWTSFAQTYTISTVAGEGLPVNILGTSASLGPISATVDNNGNLFFINEYEILRQDSLTGLLTLVAGNGTSGFSGDNGPATNAQFSYGNSIAVSAAGDVYFSDSGNFRIRKISNGIVTTVAGNGVRGVGGDNGPATAASLFEPNGIAVDSAGSIYIADGDSIRKVSNGIITTIAGGGAPGYSGDNGPASSAQLSEAAALALDSAGNLYISDYGNWVVRRISNGVITTVAGNGTLGTAGNDGLATSAQLEYVVALAVDTAGNLYIAEDGDDVRKVTNGIISMFAGEGPQGTLGFSGDGGPATNAQLHGPTSVAVNPAGSVFIVDARNFRIREVTNGTITTVAGGGSAIGDNGPAVSGQLSSPSGVAVDSAGNLFIADYDTNRIRKISNGVITTVVGNGTPGFSGDGGLATNAELQGPTSVAVDSAGNLYIADSRNYRVRKVYGGVITTFAGSGAFLGTDIGDNGPATSAVVIPDGVAVNSAGDLFIADDRRVRKVSNGVITTVAGNGDADSGGDNGLAVNAGLNPYSVAVDSLGNLYIEDRGNGVGSIRKVSNGIITSVTGIVGDIAIDSDNNLYIVDGVHVWKMSGGIVTNIGGTGPGYFSGDNIVATQADFSPSAVAVGPTGNVYVVDSSSNRIRLLTPNGTSCSFSVGSTSLQASSSGGSLTVTIQTAAGCAWVVSGLPDWITTATSSGSGPAIITLVVSANSGATQSAVISVAGTPVTIMQGGNGSTCAYEISPGGQAFTASGGSGTISVTTSLGCPWSVTSGANWITLTGATSGVGNGTVTYQVSANASSAQTGSITVAGLSFTVEESAAVVSGLNNAGSMAQIASAGYWGTTITVINTGSAAAQTRLNFFGDSGAPLTLPLTFPQSPSGSGPLLAATIDRTINPGAQLVIQTTGPTAQPVAVGWAQLLSNGTVSGNAIFSFSASGGTVQDSVAPLETRNAGGYLVPFDNTAGTNDGVAVANITNETVNIAITIRDDGGTTILTDTLSLPADGHTSFVLTDRYGSVTAQKRGTLEFRSPSSGQLSVVGIRANATGGFSDVPSVAE